MRVQPIRLRLAVAMSTLLYRDGTAACLAFYRRAYPASEAANAALRDPLSVPIVLAGGDHSVGQLNPTIAEALWARGCTNVIGRAEALRRSMLALVATDGYAHPAFWAPFVVVGEGAN